MSTTTESSSASASGRLRATMLAARLSFQWFGISKTLSSDQKSQAAESFGAEGSFIDAGKRLLDTRHPRFRAVTAVKSRTQAYWRSVSLPFPENGIRLVRQDSVDSFQQQLTRFQGQLREAVESLEEEYVALKQSAQRRLGELYCERDYPPSLLGLFDVSWDFPSVEPPQHLRQLSPQLYEEECRRVSARFEDAVMLAEQAFVEELSSIVAHLTERLSGHDDGKPKIFRDSAVGNLREFFERFQSLNVRSNDQIEDLVRQCQATVGGVQPQNLRDDQTLRRRVATELSAVQSVLDGLLVDRPRRRILRSPK
ncbi:MAG: hypothetical protein CMJ62_10865 [Planctomycetaceae bacterium]|nr:hypothetical protein [Planctomycetaceae bacterium]